LSLKEVPLPWVFLSKDVILGDLEDDFAQGCDFKWVKFTERAGQIAKPFHFAELGIPVRQG
jgi:hypothetical protein